MDRMDRPDVTVRRTTYWDPSWTGWHLDWGAVWVGALAMLVAGVAFALIALAVGAHKAVDDRVLRWADTSVSTIGFSVFGAFLAAAIGAWVAARMSGARWAEPAILQGVAAWLVLMGIVVFLATLGGAHTLAGGYLGGLTPPGAPAPTGPAPDPNTAIAARNSALGSVIGILIGLMGAVVGGWLGSGERMHPYHFRTRDTYRADPAGETRRTMI